MHIKPTLNPHSTHTIDSSYTERPRQYLTNGTQNANSSQTDPNLKAHSTQQTYPESIQMPKTNLPWIQTISTANLDWLRIVLKLTLYITKPSEYVPI